MSRSNFVWSPGSFAPGANVTPRRKERESSAAELPVARRASWDVNFPADNVVVEADGNYIVQLVVSGDSGEVTLIAQ